MTAIWALSAQAFMVFLGYCGALIAGSLFAAIAIETWTPAGFIGDTRQILRISGLSITVALAAIPATVIPTVLVVALSEGLRLRGVVAYLIFGCFVGVAMVLPVNAVFQGFPLPEVDGPTLRLSIASAAVGGFFYWLIAGRTAGLWTEMRWFEKNRR
ncbi:MAG: hypothetical protein AAGJ94_13330 [Pseudomonadota bacterium]